MKQSQSQSKALPHFERPSEAVVYWTLESLCGGAGGRFMLSMRKLAQHCRLSVNTTNRAVLSLTKQGKIGYRRGFNQSRLSIYEIPKNTGESLSPTEIAVAKIAVPIPYDSDSSSPDLYTGDSDRRDVHSKNGDTESSTPENQLAYRIADGLDDMKNLRLYKNYCRKFPVDIILKAYARAKEPKPDKIKKSRGALFNFWLLRRICG